MNSVEDDIYNDLPEETTSDYIAKIENELEETQKKRDELLTLSKELNAEIRNQEKRIKELEKTVEDYKRNISSLYKTAVAEIRRKDNMLNELRVENDDLVFRRWENHRNKPKNSNRDKLLSHKSSSEKHRKKDSPVAGTGKYRTRNNADYVRCKRLEDRSVEEKYKRKDRKNVDIVHRKRKFDSRSRHDERQQLEFKLEERSSSERNDRSGEFHSGRRHHKSLTMTMDVKERHSTSPLDRNKNSCDIRNRPEVQSSLQSIKRERRRSPEKYPMRHVVSSYVKTNPDMQNSLHCDKNKYRNGKENYLKPHIIYSCAKNGSEVPSSSRHDDTPISSQMKNYSQLKDDLKFNNESEHRNSQEKNLKLETTSSGIKDVLESKIAPITDQNKSICNRIEKLSVESTSNKEASFHLHKIEFRDPQKLAMPSNSTGNSLSTDPRIGNCSNTKNNLEPPNITVPDQTKKSNNHVISRVAALFNSDDDHTPRDVLVSNQNENHSLIENEKAKTTEEILDQMSNYFGCEAALRSMKKQTRKLLTPIKPTPDVFKQKYSQIEQTESNKRNVVVPMINEKRMLSPFKNVGVVEIICQNPDDVELSKSSESGTVAACSVTVTEDIEHGVFFRKSRKRPRIQKIISAVKTVPIC